MEYVLIGKIATTFGLKGELKIDVYTDFTEERFKTGGDVYIKDGDEYRLFKIASKRYHKERLLVAFKDHQDINLIEKYKGHKIYKAKSDIKPLKEGEYYFDDLTGLNVLYDDRLLGRVQSVEEGVRYNFLRVSLSDDKTILIPFIDNFTERVDLKEKKIIVKNLEGLL